MGGQVNRLLRLLLSRWRQIACCFVLCVHPVGAVKAGASCPLAFAPQATAPQATAQQATTQQAMALQALAGSPYALRPLPHLVGAASMLTLVGLAQLWVNPALSGRPQCPLALGQSYCDASSLRGFDRSVVSRHSKAWLRVSDAGMLLGIVAPVLGAVGEGLPYLRRGTVAAWEALQLDLTVSLEAMSVATFLNTVLKYAIRRPRPGNYSAPLQSAQGQLSFPSGHTAAAAAGLTTMTSTFWLRHPSSPWRFGLAGLTLGLTAVTGYGRVAGGMHFYSDILAGAVLGGATGYLLPQLYRRDVSLQPLSDPQGAVYGVSLTAPL